jgi:hypothetical protein
MRTNGQQIRQIGPNFKPMKGFMLLRMIEDFLCRTGMPWTKFGRIVAHDPRLVGDMRNGRSPGPIWPPASKTISPPIRRCPMRFDFRTSNDIDAQRVALFSPAARMNETKGVGARAPVYATLRSFCSMRLCALRGNVAN